MLTLETLSQDQVRKVWEIWLRLGKPSFSGHISVPAIEALKFDLREGKSSHNLGLDGDMSAKLVVLVEGGNSVVFSVETTSEQGQRRAEIIKRAWRKAGLPVRFG